jgi:ABC-type branched-subunit amino acid transport system substrate-binding protein
VNSSSIQESSCPEAAAVSLISPIPSITENNIYLRINRAFGKSFNRSLSYNDAYVYDCCWVMALSVLKAGTDDGDVVRTVLPSVASNYSGMSGPCKLDAYGDRAAVDYDIWGYFEVDGETKCLKCGFYNATTGTVTWDERLITTARGWE